MSSLFPKKPNNLAYDVGAFNPQVWIGFHYLHHIHIYIDIYIYLFSTLPMHWISKYVLRLMSAHSLGVGLSCYVKLAAVYIYIYIDTHAHVYRLAFVTLIKAFAPSPIKLEHWTPTSWGSGPHIYLVELLTLEPLKHSLVSVGSSSLASFDSLWVFKE